MTMSTAPILLEELTDSKPRRRLVLGIISLVAGVLGWLASLRLFLDYTAGLKDSSYIPSCDLSAVVGCAKNYESAYGSLLGFSNTVLGFTLFTIPVLMGILILARVQLPRWVYSGYSFGLVGAVALITFLQCASFLDLKTLCIYCLLIWTVTIPLFWSSLSVSLDLRLSPEDRAHRITSRGLYGIIVENWWLFALVHYAAVLAFGQLTIGAVTSLFEVLF